MAIKTDAHQASKTYLCIRVWIFDDRDGLLWLQLWPLRSAGQINFAKIEREGKFAKYFMITITVLSLVEALLLPISDANYDIFLPVKLAVDYLGKWALPFLIIFYGTFFHMALTVISIVFMLMYLAMHLKFQCFLLNKRLEEIERNSIDPNSVEVTHQKEYQDFSYHPELWTKAAVLTFIIICVTFAFCFIGQLLENESEKIFTSVNNLPWYIWNIENRKIVLLFSTKSQNPLILTSSGLITMNFELIIRPFWCYVILFFKQSEYHSILNETFKNLWPLKSAGPHNFTKVEKEGKFAKYFMIFMIILSQFSAASGLPLFSNNYDIFLPVKLSVDYLGKWALPYLIIFYASLSHMGFTISIKMELDKNWFSVFNIIKD
ncbi:7tm 6 domain containing protein [Asbolus verrucosus]|uniref:Odorant receptor n=1 Tax=Asbolus verrucosus TaxID=1661398 RepID=A0A482VZ52_ASBVE|nr:7tm 6 domain containing protein [Asbolus verrucosus]